MFKTNELGQGKVSQVHRLTVALTIATTALFFSQNATAKSEKAADSGVLKIGFVTDLTGSGGDSGQLQLKGGELAVKEINAAGGIGGKKIDLVVADDVGENAQAIKATRRLASQGGVIALVGYAHSAAVQQAFPAANQLEVPAISTSSAQPGLMKKLLPWGFRNTLTEAALQKVVIKAWKLKYGVKRAAVVTDVKDAYAKDLGLKLYPKLLAEANIAVADKDHMITFSTGDINFSPIATKLKSLKIDGILFAGQAAEAALLLKEMQAQGLSLPMESGVGLLHPGFLKVAGKAADGIMIGSGFWADSPEPKVKKFVSDYNEFTQGKRPGYRAASSYDTMYMIKDILEKANLGPNVPIKDQRTAIMKGLEDLKGWTGVLGETSFDELHNGVRTGYVLIAKDGAWTRYNK